MSTDRSFDGDAILVEIPAIETQGIDNLLTAEERRASNDANEARWVRRARVTRRVKPPPKTEWTFDFDAVPIPTQDTWYDVPPGHEGFFYTNFRLRDNTPIRVAHDALQAYSGTTNLAYLTDYEGEIYTTGEIFCIDSFETVSLNYDNVTIDVTGYDQENEEVASETFLVGTTPTTIHLTGFENVVLVEISQDPVTTPIVLPGQGMGHNLLITNITVAQ